MSDTLPPKENIADPITTLEYNGRKITILGTAHVSQASADKDKELMPRDTMMRLRSSFVQVAIKPSLILMH